jgi:hypothetical protein
MFQIKFHENTPDGDLTVSCGQTDIQDDADSRFRKFFAICLETAHPIKLNLHIYTSLKHNTFIYHVFCVGLTKGKYFYGFIKL